MKTQKLTQYATRWLAERSLNNDPDLVKVGDNKWRHVASGCVRWIDGQNFIMISYGK